MNLIKVLKMEVYFVLIYFERTKFSDKLLKNVDNVVKQEKIYIKKSDKES